MGTFAEYLDIVREHPEVTRTAYQRLYDMILSYGVDVTESSREKQTHYRFFNDPDNDGRDAVFEVLDGGDHGFEQEIGDARRVGAADRVLAVDADLEVDAVVAKQDGGGRGLVWPEADR